MGNAVHTFGKQLYPQSTGTRMSNGRFNTVKPHFKKMKPNPPSEGKGNGHLWCSLSDRMPRTTPGQENDAVDRKGVERDTVQGRGWE